MQINGDRVIVSVEPNGAYETNFPYLELIPSFYEVQRLVKEGSVSRSEVQRFFTQQLASYPTDIRVFWCQRGLGSSAKSLIYQWQMVARMLRVAHLVIIQRLLFFIRNRFRVPKSQFIIGYCGVSPLIWVMFDFGVMDASHAPCMMERFQKEQKQIEREMIFDRIIESERCSTVFNNISANDRALSSIGEPIEGVVIGGMSQTFTWYLLLTRCIPGIKHILQLLFPQMKRGLIIMVEHKDLDPQFNFIEGLNQAAAGVLPPFLSDCLTWIVTNSELLTEVKKVFPAAVTPHVNTSSLVMLRDLIQKEILVNVKAILVGKTETVLKYEPEIESEAIDELKHLDIPVYTNLQIGHIYPNYPLAFGNSVVNLKGENDELSLTIERKETVSEKNNRLLYNPLLALVTLVTFLLGLANAVVGITLQVSDRFVQLPLLLPLIALFHMVLQYRGKKCLPVLSILIWILSLTMQLGFRSTSTTLLIICLVTTGYLGIENKNIWCMVLLVLKYLSHYSCYSTFVTVVTYICGQVSVICLSIAVLSTMLINISYSSEE